MRPDWSAIVKALTDRNVRVSIITNGYLFSDTLISQLKELNIESVAVSLDGPERVHDSCRQKGSFRRAVTAIDTLAESAIPVSVITTLHSQNVPYLEEAKNDENAMKYIISGKSLRLFSQANHITAMNESVNNQRYNMLDSLISEYTFKGEDDYRDLASRGNG